MRISRYLQKMINVVAYHGDAKPTASISDARWRAMVAHIRREFLS